MKLRYKTHQISLVSILLCLITGQVQALSWEEVKRKAETAAREAMGEGVGDVVESQSNSQPQDEPEEATGKSVPSRVQPETAMENGRASVPANSQSASNTEFETGTPNGDLDIVGLRLGMSPGQAEAALKTYNNGLKFRYEKLELYGDSRVHQSIHRDHRVIAGTKYVSYIMASNDGSTAYSPAKKGDWFFLVFAAPPSQNRLLYIQRVRGYLDTGPTISAYDKAFIGKYGDIFFTQGFDKIVRLNSGKPMNDGDNKKCFYSIGKSLDNAQKHTYDRKPRTNNGCGLILASSHEALGPDMPLVQKITMRLTDIDEMNAAADKTRKFIEDNNQKIKDDKLEEASESNSDIF